MTSNGAVEGKDTKKYGDDNHPNGDVGPMAAGKAFTMSSPIKVGVTRQSKSEGALCTSTKVWEKKKGGEVYRVTGCGIWRNGST